MPFSASSAAWPASIPVLSCVVCDSHRISVPASRSNSARLDGVDDGVSRREIAAVLLDPQARDIPAIEWTNAALRKRINRVIARATLITKGGYLTLLRGDAGRAERFRRR